MPAFPDALSTLPEIPEPEEGEDPNFDIAVALGEDPPEPEPAAEEEEEASSESDAPDEDAEQDDIAQMAEAYKTFTEAYQANPKAFIRQLSEGLSPEDLAEMFGAPGAPSDEGWGDDDLSNASDFFVREHRQHIAELPKFREQVASDLNTVGSYVSTLAYQNAILEARLSLALEAAKISLPEIDEKAIAALAQKGKSYKEAVEEAYVKPTKRTLEAAKAKEAAKAALPTTPRDSGEGERQVDVSALAKKKNPSLNDFLPAARAMLAAQNR